MLLWWIDDPAVLGVILRDDLAAERRDYRDRDQYGEDDAYPDDKPGRAGRENR